MGVEMTLANYTLHRIEMKLNSSAPKHRTVVPADCFKPHELSFTIWILELIKKLDFFSWSTSKDTQFTGRSEGKKERNKVILGCFSRNSWNFFLSYSADCCINFGLILLTAKFAISIFIRSNTEKIALNKQTEKVIQGCRCLRSTVYKIYYRLSEERTKTCMGNINRALNLRAGDREKAWASMYTHACASSKQEINLVFL